MAEFGAFAFGVVIGWFTYFTNRYRTGGVQFSDITTLVGVIGGGAITALFGDGRSALFGAYGLGLAVGFFAYFAILVLMVSKSDGAFTWTWFLDGRRKAPKDDETTDGTRGSGTAMDMQFPAGAVTTVAASVLAEVAALRDHGVQDAFDALRDLARRIGNAEEGSERPGLVQAQLELTTKQNELLSLRLKEVRESEPVSGALVELRKAAGELTTAAGEVKSTSDALATATSVLDRLTRFIGILRQTFA